MSYPTEFHTYITGMNPHHGRLLMPITVITTNPVHDILVLSNDVDNTASIDDHDEKEFEDAYLGMEVAGDEVLVIDLSYLARLPIEPLSNTADVPISDFETFMTWLLETKPPVSSRRQVATHHLQQATLLSETAFANVGQGSVLADLRAHVHHYLDDCHWDIGTIQASGRRYADRHEHCGPVFLININT